MPIPPRKPAGLTLDPNWASSPSHPCHSLAGTLKAAIVIGTDGVVYDAAGLNTVTTLAAPTNDGAYFKVINSAPQNALKALSPLDFTVVVAGVCLHGAAAGGFPAHQGGSLIGNRVLAGNPPDVAYLSLMGDPFNGQAQIDLISHDGSGGFVKSVVDPVRTVNSQYAPPAAALYAASWTTVGTASAKVEGGGLVTQAHTAPGSSGSSVTAAAAVATSEWQFGYVSPDPTHASDGSEYRTEFALVFGAAATPSQMDYLLAHPDEMLTAGMVMSPPAGGGTPPAASSVREVFSLLPSGVLLRDKTGAVCTDATFTVLSLTDCDKNSIPPGTLQVNAMGYGAYCVEYNIQELGEAHLIVQPVSAARAFDPVAILLKYSVSNGDMQQVAAAGVSALNSENAVLTAVVAIQQVTAKYATLIEQAGTADYRLTALALANATSQLVTNAQIQADVTAAMAANVLLTKLLNAQDGDFHFDPVTEKFTPLMDDGVTPKNAQDKTLTFAGGIVISRV